MYRVTLQLNSNPHTLHRTVECMTHDVKGGFLVLGRIGGREEWMYIPAHHLITPPSIVLIPDEFLKRCHF